MVNINTCIVDDIQMDYIKFGNGKKIMVILPGLSIDYVLKYKDLIENAYSIFKDDFTVYLFDKKKNINGKYSIDSMAEDIYKVLMKLNLNNIYLFSTSLGTMISVKLALKHGETINKMALGSTTLNGIGNSIINKWINYAKDNKINDLCDSFFKDVYPLKIYENSKEIIKNLANSINENDINRFIILANSINDYNVEKEINNLKVKTLIINDKTDVLFDYKDLLKIKYNDNIKVNIIDGYGHAAYDIYEDYRKILLNYFINN